MEKPIAALVSFFSLLAVGLVCLGGLAATPASGQTLAATPQLVPSAGVSATLLEVTITCTTPGARIFYLFEEPNASTARDPVEETDLLVPADGKVSVSRRGVLKARAFADGFAPSAVASASYQVNGWVASNATHTLGLKSDRTLWAWGAQSAGRLGNGSPSTTVDVAAPTPVLTAANVPLTGIMDVAAGTSHSLAVDASGFVWAFGENASHQLAIGTTAAGSATDSAFAVKAQTGVGAFLSGIDHVTAGTSFSLARGIDGKVWAWGSQVNGRCGTGTATGNAVYAIPVKVDATIDATKPALTNIAALTAGVAFAVAVEPKTIDGTGRLWSWGLNTSGQLGDGTVTQRLGAVWVRRSLGGAQFDNVVAIDAGETHAAAVVQSATEDGTVYCWGAQANGRLGNGSAAALDVKLPTRATLPDGTPLTGIVAVACGDRHTLALDRSGRVWSWGYNASDQLGRTSTPVERPGLVAASVVGAVVVEIAAGGNGSFAVAADGRVFSWGANIDRQLGKGGETVVAPTVRIADPLLANTWKDFIIVEDLDDPDRDGLKNWEERVHGSNPLAVDTDGDTLTDGDEVHLYGTKPSLADTDADGMRDDYELLYSLDPLHNDAAENPDGDAFTNLEEFTGGTHPHDFYNAETPVVKVDGDGQKGLQGTVLPIALEVTVRRPKRPDGADGDLHPNAPVRFEGKSAVDGLAPGGLFSTSSNGSDARPIMDLRTGANGEMLGKAKLYYVLPAGAGRTLHPTVSAPGYTPAVFLESTYFQLRAPTVTPNGGSRDYGRVHVLHDRVAEGPAGIVGVGVNPSLSIHYTTEPRDPTPTDPTVLPNALLGLPDGDLTVRVKAFCPDNEPSPTGQATFQFGVSGVGLVAYWPRIAGPEGSLIRTWSDSISNWTLRNDTGPNAPSHSGGVLFEPLDTLSGSKPGVPETSTAFHLFTSAFITGGNPITFLSSSPNLSLGAESSDSGGYKVVSNFPGDPIGSGGDTSFIAELACDGNVLTTRRDGVREFQNRPTLDRELPTFPNALQAGGGGPFRMGGPMLLYNRVISRSEQAAVIRHLAWGSTELLDDSDGDGLPDWKETELGLNNTKADTDGDGLSDYEEVETYGTNGASYDTDGDGLSDYLEAHTPGLDPRGADDPDGDLDHDGLTNFDEMIYLTRADLYDTDSDGFSDGEEVSVGADPNDPSDFPIRVINIQGPSTITGRPGVTRLNLTVGDPSGSKSERWAMKVTRIRDNRLLIVHQNRDDELVRTREYKAFRQGESYRIELQWIETKRGLPTDYDWAADVQTVEGEETEMLKANPQGLLTTSGGTPGTTSTNETLNKAATITILPLRVEMRSPQATNDGSYDLSKHDPSIYPSQGSVKPGDEQKCLENALTLFFENCADNDQIVARTNTRFDLKAGLGAPLQIQGITWQTLEKPPGAPDPTPDGSDLFRSVSNYQGGIRGGLYRYKLDGTTTEGQVWLPLAGPDVSAFWQSEITYFKTLWGPAYRAKLDARTARWANTPMRSIAKYRIAMNDLDSFGGSLDWGGFPSGSYAARGGPNTDDDTFRLTLHGVVIEFHKRNNMMYGLIGREMGITGLDLTIAGNVINWIAHGGPDSWAARESYRAGYDLYDGISLQTVMLTRGRKMQESGSWARKEWPSFETASEGLVRVQEARLTQLIQ